MGGYEWPLPDLTNNHGFGDSGVISGTTSASFRAINLGLKHKTLNFGLWERVKIEFRPVGIVRKFGGGRCSVKISETR